MSLSSAFSTAYDTVGAGPEPEPMPPWPQGVLLSLASCLCAEVKDVCFCGVLAGGFPVLDYCASCEGGTCGQAWVRLTRVIPSVEATAGATYNPCSAPLEATVEVGVARCAPMPGDDGEPPSMADQLAAAGIQMEDMNAALRAIRCCNGYGRRDFDITEWVPFGPEGGCMGGVWVISLFGN